jgi:hypothetical protein
VLSASVASASEPPFPIFFFFVAAVEVEISNQVNARTERRQGAVAI